MPRSVTIPDRGGRLIEPTAADIKNIELWTAKGSGLIHIARALKVNVKTLHAWRERHPTVNEALEAGKETEHDALRSKLMELAMGGNLVAILFALKCRHGWREGEVQQQGNRVNVTFNIPGARKLEPVTIESDGTDTRTQRLPTARA